MSSTLPNLKPDAKDDEALLADLDEDAAEHCEACGELLEGCSCTEMPDFDPLDLDNDEEAPPPHFNEPT